MTNQSQLITDLKLAISDRIYIQVAGWHLYLGDAGLSEELAIECSSRFEEGFRDAAKKSLDAIQVPLAGGSQKVPLSSLVPKPLLFDLEEILEPYCK